MLLHCSIIKPNTSSGINQYQKKADKENTHIFLRKDKLSPTQFFPFGRNAGAFLFAPLRGSLTVEAAIILPLFLFFMIAALQYGRAMESAVKFGTALSETGKTMATAAYASKYGGDAEGMEKAAVGALSAVYAKQKVMGKAGAAPEIKNANMALSSFLEDGDMIDLVLTYQIKTPFQAVRLPGNFFLQRAKVRAWTGRISSQGGDGGGGGDSGSEGTVYVTETGTVYHDDPECTHLKLSIREIDAADLDSLRNNNGGKYHACEKCGAGAGGTVYITNEGNRYHSSLTCSGLKRTVKEVNREDCNLRPCSKCGKSH